MKKALAYLRVSDRKQLKKDYDADGLSLPAQRRQCHQAADRLGAEVVGEYVERAQTGRTDKRPALQALLADLASRGDIDYVIVDKVDRLARNRAHDGLITLTIRTAGAQLVSASENIDETPTGKLTHGLLATMAEFYSDNLASEVRKGMRQKARTGGTPGMAPLGYLNERVTVEGREIRTITVDPDRADLVRYAFEAYATGAYTLQRLLEELTEMGLRTRPTPKRPPAPLSRSQLQALLRSPYYIGVVTYGGERYPGRHEPLVDGQVFEAVQQQLDAHRRGGERSWIHHHYLKGTLCCGRCQSRLSLMLAKGNGGTYPYFYCLGRATKRTNCDLRWLPVDVVEDAVEAYYRTHLSFPADVIQQVRDGLAADLAALEEVSRSELDRQRRLIRDIERRRREVALKTEDGIIPDDIGRERQNELAVELAAARSYLAKLEGAKLPVEEQLGVAMSLLARCADAYASAGDTLRRQWNQALFERLEIDDACVEGADLAPPFDQLTDPRLARRYAAACATGTVRRQSKTRSPKGSGFELPAFGSPDRI